MTTEILYTPWRNEYVTSQQKKLDGCIFCTKLHDDMTQDRENYVIYRGKKTFVLMNIFPYNPGHLMIVPQSHISTLSEISRDTQIEMMILISYFTELLSQIMRPDGFNIGMNIGGAAGAGIASHLHAHIVPRWGGDANFMSIVGNTRVLPETLDDTYNKIMTWLQKQPPDIASL